MSERVLNARSTDKKMVLADTSNLGIARRDASFQARHPAQAQAALHGNENRISLLILCLRLLLHI